LTLKIAKITVIFKKVDLWFLDRGAHYGVPLLRVSPSFQQCDVVLHMTPLIRFKSSSEKSFPF